MMEKKLFVLLISLIWGHMLFAQDVIITEKPTANWPFYFEDFVGAQIILNDDVESITNTKVNINLFTGELQYLDPSGTIRILENTEDVKKIVINDELEFMFVSDFLQKIVIKGSKYMILEERKGQVSDIQESSGAYGASTATSSVNQVEGKMIGGVNYFDYTYMIENKVGSSFKPELKYYIIGKDFAIPFNKRNLNKQFSKHSKEISSFIKKEKLNLKKEESFSLVLNLLENLD